MSKKIFYLAMIALVSFSLTSCEGLFGGKEKIEYRLSDLQALWQETTVKGSQHFVRFTTEASDETPYFLGREWDEAEEIYESDLLESRETLGHPGNGWFKYWMETSGNLTEIHLMDNGGAEIPKIYVVSKLNSTTLEYYEKDRKTNKFYFEKVVTTK